MVLTETVCLAVAALSLRKKALSAVFLYLSIVIFGMLLTVWQKPKTNVCGEVEVVVISSPQQKPKTMAVDVMEPKSGLRWRCYIWADDDSRQIKLGQPLVVHDPGTGFVRSKDWQWGGDAALRMSALQRVRIKLLRQREKLLGEYRSLHFDAEVMGVLAAMTLGDKSGLSGDVREVYNISGASHALALSGMHLFVVYMLLSYLMLRRRRNMLVQSVTLLSIWAFALLTGLSVSIMRAAVMISVAIIMGMGDRRGMSLNVLFFTVIVMLVADTRQLYDVGFQLSFAAVLSILLWMPLFDDMVSQSFLLRHQAVRWLWGVVAVSVSAQIGVAPLIAFYFGRFSVYFVLTNIVISLLMTMIIAGGLLFLIFRFSWMGHILGGLVETMNRALALIAQMPCSTIEGLHPSVFQLCLLYFALGMLYLALRIYLKGIPSIVGGR